MTQTGTVFRIAPRELAVCGVFGAAALLLPSLFHLVHLGHVFMPMYLPLVALAFFVRPAAAGLTALIVPLLSGAATGMPPLNPPVAPVMALELALMAGAIAGFRLRVSSFKFQVSFLAAVLMLGRVFHAMCYYAWASAMGLSPKPLALAAFLSGWPGLVLMLAVIPQVVLLHERIRR
jgi:thiamine transporter ThiT